MKTVLRLESIIPDGVGGAEANSISLMYSYFLSEFLPGIYRYICINQIGDHIDGPDELIVKEPGNFIHINIRYKTYDNLASKTGQEQNLIRLDVIHEALIRLANFDGKFSIEQLKMIKAKLIASNFSFAISLKEFKRKGHVNQIANLIVRPEITQFKFYVRIKHDDKTKCETLIYTGIPTHYYAEKFFFYGKWKDEKEFILSGKDKTVETHILIESCSVDVVNLTPYKNPPYYTLMRIGVTKEEKDQADKDWHHSMSPAEAAIIRQVHGGASN